MNIPFLTKNLFGYKVKMKVIKHWETQQNSQKVEEVVVSSQNYCKHQEYLKIIICEILI